MLMTLLWIQGCSMDYLLDNSGVRKNILFNRVFPFCKKIHSCRRIAGVNSGCEQLKKKRRFSWWTAKNICIPELGLVQGGPKKKDYFYKQTNTSYSETTILLDVEICLLGVLMSTSCWQISTSNRIVVSEYEVFVC